MNLESRLFKYRLSYLIYSEPSPGMAHLGGDERRAILQILEATKPDFSATRE